MSSHIAVFNIPAIGHIFPTLGVVEELIRRGHRVTYPVIPERAGVVGETGARTVPYSSLRPSDRDPNFAPPDRSEHLGRSLLNFLAEADATLPELAAAFDGDQPDLILFDRLAFAGRVYAEQRGIPSIQLWPMMISSKEWSIANVVPIDPTHHTFAEYNTRLAKFLADQGLTITADEFLDPAVRRNLAFYPRAFQYDGDRYGAAWEFVGPCTGDRAGRSGWTPPASGRPVALISLGTLNNRQPGFYRMCFEAFEGSPWHVVLPIGQRMDRSELGPIPANFEVAATVPQVDILDHAQVFVSHAGMGGVMEALGAGVPQVALAGTLEQDINAGRLDQLNIGVRLSFADLTATVLRDTVERVAVDPVIAESVARLRKDVLTAGGPARAADIIESCLP
ncbi:MGT family glycosyltransferase [Allocatelliglobosispora scoriae]|uniref:MGT family glycosyltransferase n=1 Tax=Allocatelliglobosispora scoriae TaxID=643052 RepID=A0A841C097_9ACTN|nr:macrolide family glycosyltransferase [Allocatelliglobosispora scoriae]MBB5872573.1 MGT family glycosyltransferase [Allocatelliglobosispora scoriae]